MRLEDSCFVTCKFTAYNDGENPEYYKPKFRTHADVLEDLPNNLDLNPPIYISPKLRQYKHLSVQIRCHFTTQLNQNAVDRRLFDNLGALDAVFQFGLDTQEEETAYNFTLRLEGLDTCDRGIRNVCAEEYENQGVWAEIMRQGDVYAIIRLNIGCVPYFAYKDKYEERFREFSELQDLKAQIKRSKHDLSEAKDRLNEKLARMKRRKIEELEKKIDEELEKDAN
jgi:hypothetical protein